MTYFLHYNIYRHTFYGALLFLGYYLKIKISKNISKIYLYYYYLLYLLLTYYHLFKLRIVSYMILYIYSSCRHYFVVTITRKRGIFTKNIQENLNE